MAIVLFDLQQTPNALIDLANQTLSRLLRSYFKRYGEIGSKRWWTLYADGKLTVTRIAGEITHIGPAKDQFDEEHDIIRIQTDRRDIEYDRTDYWRDPRLQLGSWVAIEQVKIIAPHAYGNDTHILDVRVILMENSLLSLRPGT